MKNNTDSFHYKGNNIIETTPEKDEALQEVKTNTLTVCPKMYIQKETNAEHEWLKLLKLDQAVCVMLSLKVEDTPETVNMCETVTLCGEA